MTIREKEQEQQVTLDTIYLEHRNYMLSIARSYIDDAQVSEDVFHNAFISVIRNQERVMQLPLPKLKAYLLLAVRHASIDYLRKERRMNLVDVSDDVLMYLIANSRDVLTTSEMPFQTVEFYEVIRKMPTEDQTLLIGKHIIGLDSNELAQILDCKPGTVRVKLHRANKRAFELFTSLGLRFEDFLL